METKDQLPEDARVAENILGYLNFSSGGRDPQFLSQLDYLFTLYQDRKCSRAHSVATWQAVVEHLTVELARLRPNVAALRDSVQARSVLELMADRVVDDYMEFHSDLLFHQTQDELIGSFMLGQMFEALLAQDAAWDEPDLIVTGTLSQLNDFIGHRPVATLERRKAEPYSHEWVHLVPLYIQTAGTANSRYKHVVETALEILRQAPVELLREAYFDLDRMQELAYDPRACDFDHPVSKRPNYQFGQWDPHQINNQGYYDRFVIQQVTLDALMERTEEENELGPQELNWEAAAVLAGVILMASGVSGSGPDTHDSSVTLANLLPGIASYRDRFYQHLLERCSGDHGKWLRAESKTMRQPFGGARQHLNAQLARRRAAQLEHVHLAKIFARMGYAEAAARQTDVVPVASARMLCQIDCRLTTVWHAVSDGSLEEAGQLLGEIKDLLHRAIECGAVIDPWNILGFDAHFSLFPALENSIRDHRADELVDLMEQIFGLYSKVWSAAAVADETLLCSRLSAQFYELAEWWHRFAVHQLGSLQVVNAMDAYTAAERVATALGLWHKGGAAAGDIAFWTPHAEVFNSVEAYAMAADALLEHGDFVASLGLLVHWLSQGGRVPLEQGNSSFYRIAEQWVERVRRSVVVDDAQQDVNHAVPVGPTVEKFLDYIEANADDLLSVPTFDLGVASSSEEPDEFIIEDDDENSSDSRYEAAYESVVFRDSTDDGVEGSIFDQDETTFNELEDESRRISTCLAFLKCRARLWKLASSPLESTGSGGTIAPETLQQWYCQATENRRSLSELLQSVQVYRISSNASDFDSVIEYDRQRFAKESLLEQIIATTVETIDAARYLCAASAAQGQVDVLESVQDLESSETRHLFLLTGAVFADDIDRARNQLWPDLVEALGNSSLLYIPLAKGGDPGDIVEVRARQRAIRDLLVWLPRKGMLLETCELIELARNMERLQIAGAAAVTEFDNLFESGYRAIVEAIIAASNTEQDDLLKSKINDGDSNEELLACLEQLTQMLLASWLSHSHTLRLSVLEKLTTDQAWQDLVRFIQRYGEDLFTQQFFNLGNLRGILHQGVNHWIYQLSENTEVEELPRLFEDLDGGLSRKEAAEHLTLVLEAIVENYSEYRDYNTTTTLSDNGKMLYTLLDFLRLRSEYDRVAWHLKPVILAHEILVRHGFTEAAEMWRRALVDRIDDKARWYLERVKTLQRDHAMQLRTVADRIGERFVRPMAIDRIRALVRPALEEAVEDGPQTAFDLLEQEALALAHEPLGSGVDIPAWLIALEEEVEHCRYGLANHDSGHPLKEKNSRLSLRMEEVQRQLDQWDRDRK